MNALSSTVVAESSSKGFIKEFPGFCPVVTIVTVRKWDGNLILIFVAAGFSSFLKKYR